MKTLKLFIRVLLIPVWITIFFIYLFIWYIQMSWYYFDFDDYIVWKQCPCLEGVRLEDVTPELSDLAYNEVKNS